LSLRLAETFQSVINGADEFIDVTLLMAFNFTDADRTVVESKLRYTTPDEPAYLALRIGLRSQILKGFARFSEEKSGRYLPCDIPSLVPAICIMVSHRMKGLDGSIICDHETTNPTNVVLTFKGEADHRRSNLDNLAVGVNNVMERWKGWTDVLLSILSRDPRVGDWEIDWREVLAGESGYVTMPWFVPMSYADRTDALDSIVSASYALLTSFLSPAERRNRLVIELQEWLRTIKPRLDVKSTALPGILEVT
jgi:hypothetical protein